MRTLDRSSLPDGWDGHPAPAAARAIGDEWATGGSSALLAVPSAVIPEELNYLLNPAHPDVARIVVNGPRPLRPDPRLLGRK